MKLINYFIIGATPKQNLSNQTSNLVEINDSTLSQSLENYVAYYFLFS